jgi:hypothetical protein
MNRAKSYFATRCGQITPRGSEKILLSTGIAGYFPAALVLTDRSPAARGLINDAGVSIPVVISGQDLTFSDKLRAAS